MLEGWLGITSWDLPVGRRAHLKIWAGPNPPEEFLWEKGLPKTWVPGGPAPKAGPVGGRAHSRWGKSCGTEPVQMWTRPKPTSQIFRTVYAQALVGPSFPPPPPTRLCLSTRRSRSMLFWCFFLRNQCWVTPETTTPIHQMLSELGRGVTWHQMLSDPGGRSPNKICGIPKFCWAWCGANVSSWRSFSTPSNQSADTFFQGSEDPPSTE